MTNHPNRGRQISCQCGNITGELCQWHGARAETVLVEYMPEWLRASHEAAGNSGYYPHNGAERYRIHRDCARHIVDGEWCTEV